MPNDAQEFEEPPPPKVEDLIPALASALQTYASSLSGVAVTKTTFELEPDEPDWVIRARLKCYGDLVVPEPQSPEEDTLGKATPIEVSAFRWEAKGESLEAAVRTLVNNVQRELARRITDHELKMAEAKTALRALSNPTELQDLWPTEDPEEMVAEDG